MTYEPLPIETVSLDALELDLENYRIPTRRDDQAAALAYLFASEDVLEACRMILRNGYFDNEVPIVVEEAGKYVVLEGNRRVSALKAMQDPALVPEHEIEVRALLKRFALEEENLPTEIRVIVASDRDAAAPHIARLHTGLSKRPWSRDQQATYYYSLLSPTTTLEDVRARYPGVGVARFIRMAVVRRFLAGVRFKDVSLHDYVTGDSLKMSAFEYAYRRKDIADRVGIAFQADGLLLPSNKAPEKVGKMLLKSDKAALELLLTEFRAGNLNTRSSEFASVSETRAELFNKMDAAAGRTPDPSPDLDDPEGTDEPDDDDLDNDESSSSVPDDDEASPDDSGAPPTPEGGEENDADSGDPGAGQEDGDGDSYPSAGQDDNQGDEPAAAAAGGQRGPNHPDTKDTLTLTGLNYGEHAPDTLQRRYIELRSINIRKFPAATAMLLRSVLETTIKFHFENTATPANGELRPSVDVLAAAYGNEKAIKAQIGRLKSGGESTPGSIQWFNLVAHSADFLVRREDVQNAWVLVQPILRRLLHPGQH